MKTRVRAENRVNARLDTRTRARSLPGRDRPGRLR